MSLRAIRGRTSASPPWLAKARLILMVALGSEWSARWLAAGFTHRGTNVPKRLGARIELARSVAEFFQAHPGFAVPFAGVTASAGHALHGESTAAAREMRETAREAGECKRHRDAAEKHLRRKMRCTVLMLSAMLDENDPRWLAFGLNIPKPHAPAPRKPCTSAAPAPVVSIALAEPPPLKAVA